MRKIVTVVAISLISIAQFAQDWDGIPVPADAGEGMIWELQEEVSDDFNYTAPAGNLGDTYYEKWTDFYHNTWTGPGLTVWNKNQIYVENGLLHIPAERLEPNKISTGCITSKTRVQYPAYVEAYAKIMNSTLASDVWMLSPDDTQEIDIIEAYGDSYCDSVNKDMTWFAQRIHISHHVFIRSPFQDYQPTDAGSWYYNGTTWRLDYHRVGVYWKDPWNLEYYVDGKLVRTVSGEDIIDPNNFTNGTGLNKAMDIIINVEDQNWRSDQGWTPTDAELENQDDHTFKVDWIRVYKPIADPTISSRANDSKPFSIYPNPVSDLLKVSSENEIAEIKIYDLSGAERKNVLNSSEIQISDLKSGIYFINIKLHTGDTYYDKFMKL